MSDEEYVDIDQDEEGSGPLDENITDLFDVVISDPTPADKRAHHNALERKRRDHIKDSFNTLMSCLPTINSYRCSRAQALKKATEYIVLLKRKNNKLITDIELLKSQGLMMEQQVTALEKVRTTSLFAADKDLAAAETSGENVKVETVEGSATNTVVGASGSNHGDGLDMEVTAGGDTDAEPAQKRTRLR